MILITFRKNGIILIESYVEPPKFLEKMSDIKIIINPHQNKV